ncbi:MAG: sigma 54-interacting transcriptional regulator [Pirellulales bacterium]
MNSNADNDLAYWAASEEMAHFLEPWHVQFVVLAQQKESIPTFLEAVLPTIVTEISAVEATVYRQNNLGTWEHACQHGAGLDVDAELLTSALERQTPVFIESGVVISLGIHASRPMVLAVYGISDQTEKAIARYQFIAKLFSYCLQFLTNQSKVAARSKRLEQLLEIIEGWQKSQDMLSLLNDMANAATELFASERASIFLWDRPNKLLVGRPALGVENGELRIPDDRGVVGQVVQTGEPRRTDELEQKEIDRAVDQKLEFHTRNLLCVPLLGKRGKIFGAFELINKLQGNFTAADETGLTELAVHAATALENTQEIQQLIANRDRLADAAAAEIQMIGNCSAIQEMQAKIEKVSSTDLPVMVLGENGTGKEVVSRMIHYRSDRRNQPLIAVNCAALADTLLESELFGHEKGAFTDAHESRAGKFELAHQGTLFLDEIGDMSLAGQAKLLRVIEDKIITKVGGTEEIYTDVRVIAATNQDLGAMVRDKTFREDLFFRLNVVAIDLPALRDREDDILLLAEHFLTDFAAKAHRKMPVFTKQAKLKMFEHRWPGNVRELRNTMERIAFLVEGDSVEADMFSFNAGQQEVTAGQSMNQPLPQATANFQCEYIQKHLDISRGNISQAAEKIGMHRSNLHRKMKQLGMLDDE